MSDEQPNITVTKIAGVQLVSRALLGDEEWHEKWKADQAAEWAAKTRWQRNKQRLWSFRQDVRSKWQGFRYWLAELIYPGDFPDGDY